MGKHAIRWTFDRGSVVAEAICNAEPGADCRLTSVTCECEEWGEIWRRDDGTIWHKIVDYGDSIEPRWHEVKPQDDCNVCLFINESGCVEEGRRHIAHLDGGGLTADRNGTFRDAGANNGCRRDADRADAWHEQQLSRGLLNHRQAD